MTNSLIQAALQASVSTEAAGIWPQLEQLVLDTIEATLSIDAMVKRLTGDLADLSGLSNAAPVAEGRVLEQTIATVAGFNPALTVLTNIRLPVPDAASRRDSHQAPVGVMPTLDFDTPSRRTYTPDLILADPTRRVAWLIDIKRSLASYDPLRRDDLKNKLLASRKWSLTCCGTVMALSSTTCMSRSSKDQATPSTSQPGWDALTTSTKSSASLVRLR